MAEQINFITPDLNYVHQNVDKAAFSILKAYQPGTISIINLCGGMPVFGIPYELTIDAIANSTTAIKVTIATHLYTAVRRINFATRVIFNDLLVVEKGSQGVGLGTRLFCNQVKEAKRRGFRRLDVTAIAPDGVSEWQGYYSWGRLGFQMEPEDHEDLMQMLDYLGRPETNLWELLQTADGQDLWRRDGFTWHGSFYLHEGSQSLPWLKEYLTEKGKDYEI